MSKYEMSLDEILNFPESCENENEIDYSEWCFYYKNITIDSAYGEDFNSLYKEYEDFLYKKKSNE